MITLLIGSRNKATNLLLHMKNIGQPKYHQYRVVGDFNNIKYYVENCSDPKMKLKVEAYMKKYRLSYDNLIIYKGIIASGFGSPGGGIQYELPLPVDMLEGLGLLEKIQ